jgi:Methyltransferase domain
MSFLSEYRKGFDSLASMCSFDAGLFFAIYNSLIAERGIAGPTLEIGVHYGASAVVIAALRKSTAPFVAIDLFSELQDQNVSKSGSGDREMFLANMRRFYPDTSFIRVIASPSSAVTAGQLGEGYSFCHIDGGHSDRETFGDLRLCSEIAAPGGLIALDDYFHPNYPGVSEGTVRFMLENRGKLRPVAIGYNKVLFQREPVPFDINAAFADQFGFIPRVTIEHFGFASFLFSGSLEYFFDLAQSSLTQLVRRPEVIRAGLTPEVKEVRAHPNQSCTVPIRVGNESTIPFQVSDPPIALSYHLKTLDGRMLVHDNIRTFFREPLFPGQGCVVNVLVVAPATAGSYQLEFDLVWESILWFKDRGSPTRSIPLVVS